MERQILLLGDPRLYETSEEVTREELEEGLSILCRVLEQ